LTLGKKITSGESLYKSSNFFTASNTFFGGSYGCSSTGVCCLVFNKALSSAEFFDSSSLICFSASCLAVLSSSKSFS
jgi:hypothetical protein